jgi:hypothetical protein
MLMMESAYRPFWDGSTKPFTARIIASEYVILSSISGRCRRGGEPPLLPFSSSSAAPSHPSICSKHAVDSTECGSPPRALQTFTISIPFDTHALEASVDEEVDSG